jgi:acetyl-CoA carboxylase biotin carboxyl carrier protein
MNEQQLKQLITDLAALDFVHAKIKLDDFELELERPDTTSQFTQQKQTRGDVIVVKSPMIGIFHVNEEPLQVGQRVETGMTVGQIESMKLFNEVTSPASGVVERVLCEDGQTVEYDQPLIEIREGA